MLIKQLNTQLQVKLEIGVMSDLVMLGYVYSYNDNIVGLRFSQ